jgi:acyl-coenzyme A thioesterase PaaI-like protein
MHARIMSEQRVPPLRRVLQGLRGVVGTHNIIRLLGVFPVFVAAGVRVTHVSKALDRVDVEMGLHPWNVNWVGTHFGGSLYAMCDPFLMILLMERLGSGFVVWDKAATIQFKRPGRMRVRASFRVDDDTLRAIRADVDARGRAQPTFEIDVVDDEGNVVCHVQKVISVKRA